MKTEEIGTSVLGGGNELDLITHYSSQQRSQNFETQGVDFKSTAFYSLKLALKGYFSSYQSMITQLEKSDLGTEDIIHSEGYYESFLETIVHFQHFFELIIKDILEKDSPLLVVKANTQPNLLHKLIKGEEIQESEYNKLFSVEFSEALKTLIELLKKGRITNTDYKIFQSNKDVLTALNSFRNRIWHRGRFALKYHALDEFMGKHILPFMLEIVKLKEYEKYENVWKNRTSNKLGINVINEIIDEFKKVDPDFTKVALLKEIGRVEISTPDLYHIKFHRKSDLPALTEIEMNRRTAYEIFECPVCGNESLLNHYEYEAFLEELGDEMTPHFSTFWAHEMKEDRVECFLCQFEVKKFVKNPEQYGYDVNFRFWKS